MRNLFSIALAIGAVFSANTSFAVDNTNTIEAKVQKSPVGISYSGIYDGGQLSNPLNAQSPTGTDAMGGAQRLRNVVYIGYRATDELSFGPRIEFHYKLTQGQSMSLQDFAVKAEKSNLIKTSNFNLWADLRAYLPTTDASKAFGIVTGIRSTQIASYNLPGTRWSLSTMSYLWANTFNTHSVVDGEYRGNLEYYIAPSIQYQLNSKLAFVWTYEMGGKNKLGESIAYMIPDVSDLQTGISYDFSGNFNLSPFVEIYPSQNITINNAKLGMYITAKLI